YAEQNKVLQSAAAEPFGARSCERPMALTSRPAISLSAKPNDARDVVFTFYQEAWADAVGHGMYMAGGRPPATLMSEPSVRRLLVANPYRSTPIQWARRLSGQRPVPFPAAARWALVEPRRLLRRDPTSVRALERVYDAYDRILEGAAANLGTD